MAKSSKTAKSTEANESAPKKAENAKPASSPKKTPPMKKGPTKKTADQADPATKLEKACKDAVAKLQTMENGKYQEIREKLEWCIGSYNYDKNPEGLIEYGKKASDAFKELREENPRKVSKKLVEDLDKALGSF